MEKDHQIEQAISILQSQTNAYLLEIKKLVTELSVSKKFNVISYFTYSLNISHDSELENMCIGSYHILNIGSQPITNPYICITLSEDAPFSFSGRYVYKDSKQSLKVKGGWERINEQENKKEFWLKPLDTNTIHPQETLSFTNFQIKWMPAETYGGSVLGFSYSDQLKDGLSAVNPINLNGSVYKKEG
ncbi:hypothetical protein LF817_02235 [Halobacillus sp. A1]|uniref:hypothetical protein n=1 Tax=Halobacillus sp. A1 TaxID=2880262 RepID=UPI0020A6570B|nr:hypothetical protein [Halobacillus sp. A1]MCP3030155.1 hypothetical protein [Halobacillus sp. A1]